MPRSEPVIPVVEQLAQENKFLGVWTGSVGTKEDIDRYKDEATLVVYFPVGSVRVIPEFENNRAQLDHLLSVLDKIAEDKNSRIAKILVVGSASPDGSAELNSRIAANRAQVLVDYITSRTRLSPSYFEVKNDQVSWRLLRKLVANSDMDFRQQVLHIIDTAPGWDAKKKVGRLGLLMEFNGGKLYHYMKQHFFPKLRNAGYIKVFYEAQPTPNSCRSTKPSTCCKPNSMPKRCTRFKQHPLSCRQPAGRVPHDERRYGKGPHLVPKGGGCR